MTGREKKSLEEALGRKPFDTHKKTLNEADVQHGKVQEAPEYAWHTGDVYGVIAQHKAISKR